MNSLVASATPVSHPIAHRARMAPAAGMLIC